MEARIPSIFNNERKRTVNVATEESECKYENTESTSSDAAQKGPSNVVFITLIFDESHFLDDSKKTATIAFYFELMKQFYGVLLEGHVSLKRFCTGLATRQFKHEKGYANKGAINL